MLHRDFDASCAASAGEGVEGATPCHRRKQDINACDDTFTVVRAHIEPEAAQIVTPELPSEWLCSTVE